MVKVTSVSKRYGTLWALRNVSFEVPAGQVLGLLGRNGAGKSTLLNVLSGCTHPTSGEVSINGSDMLLHPLDAKHSIGFLPEVPPLYDEMTIEAYLRFCIKLKDVVNKQQANHLEEISLLAGLTDVLSRRVGNMSRGYRQRIGLAQALAGTPEVLLLDEPTAGFDPPQAADFRALIRSLSKQHTIILSSHILSEVESVCDRVLILHEGALVYDQEKDRSQSSTRKVRLRALLDENKLLSAIRSLPSAQRVHRQNTPERGAEVIIETAVGSTLEEDVFALLQCLQAPILVLTPLSESLEDIFLRISASSPQEQAV